jgi:23S rRNA (uracil1939-C5)-methyltransferase
MILETLMEHHPTQLVYVSCNPATLARDLVTLKQSFRIDSITPLDMFPQTAEIEVVADLHA